MTGIWLLLIFAPMLALCGYLVVMVYEEEFPDKPVDKSVDNL